MRIIAGRFKGRKLKSVPGEKTRPTADRVREALFSILGGAVPGIRVLDLFAGTGALGLEALSRGAAKVVFVENHRPALEVIRANISGLGREAESEIMAADWRSALARLGERGERFGLILADPPYRAGGEMNGSPGENILSRIDGSGTLQQDGLVAVEHLYGLEPVLPPGAWRRLQAKRYGRTGLTIYSIIAI
ncbi:MAG: 16S rRNA (guanine(966)-N(2))-methyltransferase RsmD [PVC group bacterium]